MTGDSATGLRAAGSGAIVLGSTMTAAAGLSAGGTIGSPSLGVLALMASRTALLLVLRLAIAASSSAVGSPRLASWARSPANCSDTLAMKASTESSTVSALRMAASI